MLITSARVDPVTSGPVPVANGPSSARSCEAGNGGPAGNREVATRKELGHWRQRVDVWCPGESQRLTDVLGVHDDLAEVGRGVSRGGGGAADDGAEPVECLGGGAAPVLDHPALVVHVDTETRAEHAAPPPPLIQACRGGEVGDDLLDVPLPAQGAVPPLLGTEARQVLRQRSPFSVRKYPEVIVVRFLHSARYPSCSRAAVVHPGGSGTPRSGSTPQRSTGAVGPCGGLAADATGAPSLRSG